MTSAREVIAQAVWDRLKIGESVHEVSDRIMERLGEAGFTVARLEELGWDFFPTDFPVFRILPEEGTE